MPPTLQYIKPLSTPSQQETAQDIALQIHNLLAPLNQILAAAEPLTAGLLSSIICSIPGASTMYRGAIIAKSLHTPPIPNPFARLRQLAPEERRGC
ncbi:hypothetical protein EG328_003988 [Venturia inaequalis]|uniref:CinA C-terminal domain-containing protein n=1 Tax=Venturia inaequalis TaxID=5025 RepID=A0A8H3YYC9_VENIN|nr:hypothetical protein EG328_003988 [Venturia inaequalis]